MGGGEKRVGDVARSAARGSPFPTKNTDHIFENMAMPPAQGNVESSRGGESAGEKRGFF